MIETPKKVVVIGLDCALTHLIDKHIQEGHLPTFKKLFDNGAVAENCLPNFPTITPPNWATLATGAWAGTHGITDFHMHRAGTSPININTEAAFSSERCQAEFIWDAADQAGKKCIVLNYPGSWPSNLKNGVMVAGKGLGIAERRDGQPGLRGTLDLCHDQLISTELYPNAIKGTFVEAKGWEGVDELGGEPLEMAAQLNFPMAEAEVEDTTWHILARELGDDGYDTITLSPTKKMADAFCTLKVGQWSQRVDTTMRLKDGTEKNVFFRVKLIELSDDAEDFRLFISTIGATTGWSSPPEIAETLISETGTYAPGGGVRGYSVGWFGLDTYVELNEQYSQWMADAASKLLTEQEWDMFFMHSHPIDWAYHALMSDMDPATQPDEKIREAAWDAHLKVYQYEDKTIARILESIDEEETLVCLVSDHGATADGPKLNPYDILVPAGLTELQEDQISEEDLKKILGIADEGKNKLGIYDLKATMIGATIPDMSKSKAMPQRTIYIYINLKGRDPEGIVEPADYEKVQRQIIDALYAYVEPTTGRRPVALALSKQDARILGLYGDRMGDVVYALYPEFGSQHGQALGTASRGVGTLRTLFTMTGPGVKKGVRLDRTVILNDLVPTICYLSGMPVPANCEGAVLYQAFSDPDFKRKQVAELKEKLAEMEKKLS